MYRKWVDLVLLESYFPAVSLVFPFHFSINYNAVKTYGIEDKTVMALGIGRDRWLTEFDDIKKRMEYIHRRAPEMPGIGFFAPKIGVDLLHLIEEEAVRLYGSPR
jgi:hypothetical protein